MENHVFVPRMMVGAKEDVAPIYAQRYFWQYKMSQVSFVFAAMISLIGATDTNVKYVTLVCGLDPNFGAIGFDPSRAQWRGQVHAIQHRASDATSFVARSVFQNAARPGESGV
jgi:hypothetical protein